MLLLMFLLCGILVSPVNAAEVNGSQGPDYKDNSERPVAETGRVAELDWPATGDTVTYSGPKSAFSVAYKPVLLWYAFWALVVLSVGYYVVRKYRRKGEP
ncbi:hypothetical protein FGU65_15265 [Methanoculleus sp. FWC-SCC1]|uniref:Uncharacterized protein n=1 Tax=Methanoculleus frigidifontis TaxID=2584085 RepID=A0ABT8ME47_9EURY|nr:hypothetical protein [Methanoculleus sp. FWC-SCC1]MDN7026220.1 hypothetical protein [Methanoculleus sp. FWC-SCC1]